MTNLKTCTKCNEAKPTSEFYKDRTKVGGRSSCKVCDSARRVKWAFANPIEQAAQVGKSKAVRRFPNCVPEDFDFEATVHVYAERIRLTKATGIEHHVDHIVSLKDGGLHHHANLQVLTASDNRAKG